MGFKWVLLGLVVVGGLDNFGAFLGGFLGGFWGDLLTWYLKLLKEEKFIWEAIKMPSLPILSLSVGPTWDHLFTLASKSSKLYFDILWTRIRGFGPQLQSFKS